ncbi:hypothetical protein [Bradyrhizobium zhanjiangense]|uniref:Lipoprotein n=1 Tax=Bradyrhizobium zhanjiangense TaxID=1325107 RepID=A0A4Q0Q813_9BRAD|nr:hypothetical protein [Bradyrhizobium zhanjiangense]RXG85338.1 hypothetical protein EAS61_36415 [Bradyrhizobium zhanjiangense]
MGVMRLGAVALLAISLGGCGAVAMIQSRSEYQDSAEKYKSCLAANTAAPQNCEALRLAMETDERKFNNMSGRGVSANSDVTVRAR